MVWRHASDPLVDVAKAWHQTRGGQAQAEHLDLALLARVADRLPLALAHRQLLQELAPQGVVSDLDLSWEGAATAPSRYRVKARVQGLGLAESREGMRPGLAQADVMVSATDAGGRADLAMKQGWLSFPGVFEEPRIPLDRLDARVEWSRQPGGGGAAPAEWSVRVSNTDSSCSVEAAMTSGWSVATHTSSAPESCARSATRATIGFPPTWPWPCHPPIPGG